MGCSWNLIICTPHYCVYTFLLITVPQLLGCVFVWLMVTKLWSLVFDILYMHNMQSYRVGDLLRIWFCDYIKEHPFLGMLLKHNEKCKTKNPYFI